MYYNNPYMMQNSYPYMQQNSNEPQIQYCDSYDFVKSQNVRLDGQANFYAKTDGSEIYSKKINPTTGASITNVYRRIDEDVRDNPEAQVVGILSSFKTEISNEISELKELILENATAPSQSNKKLNL